MGNDYRNRAPANETPGNTVVTSARPNDQASESLSAKRPGVDIRLDPAASDNVVSRGGVTAEHSGRLQRGLPGHDSGEPHAPQPLLDIKSITSVIQTARLAAVDWRCSSYTGTGRGAKGRDLEEAGWQA